jgi:hypothetical protein
MAQLPLNKFLTKTAVLTTNTTATVYTAPIGVTSIVLMAQVANLTTITQTVSFQHYRYRTVLADAQGFGGQPGLTASYLVKDFAIPENDAGTPLTGKMIIESLDKVYAYAGNENALQLVLSVLETANA